MKKQKYKCPICGYYNAHQLGCPEVGKKIKLCDIVKDYKSAKENGEEYKLPPNL
jgi:hypothetical protein